jgi:hypothetical protein
VSCTPNRLANSHLSSHVVPPLSYLLFTGSPRSPVCVMRRVTIAPSAGKQTCFILVNFALLYNDTTLCLWHVPSAHCFVPPSVLRAGVRVTSALLTLAIILVPSATLPSDSCLEQHSPRSLRFRSSAPRSCGSTALPRERPVARSLISCCITPSPLASYIAAIYRSHISTVF